MTAYFDSTRRPLHIGLKVGQGGEATVFQISGTADLVAKIYHRPTPAKAAKLRLMLHNVPIDPTRASGHVSIAWPTELVLDANGVVRGFVMPRLDYAVSTPLFNLYHPATRQQRAPGFTWEYLLRTARNLASVVGALHRDGYVVGDLNESNLLVSNTAMVTLVDCDSVQVPQVGTAHVFRCPVGKAEYSPPELQGADFSAVDRRPEHDSFGLAILIFLVLMEGVHPFSGIWKGSGAPPTVEQNISAGNCPYTRPSIMAPPPHALPFAMLPPAVQDLFRRCFGQGLRDAGARPAAEEWQQVLLEAEGHLTRCRRFPQHVYADHLGQCPWCERVQQGLPDPFPSPSTQAPLPPTLIQAAPARPPARTAPPRTATPGLLRRWHTWAVLVLVGLAVTQGPQWLAASGPSSVRPTPTLTSAPIAVAGAQAVGSLKGEVLQQATAGASPPPATVPPAPTATAPPPPTLPPISTPASPTPAPRPVPPQLAARSVGSGSVRAGGSVTFSYELVNPGSVPVDAVLGASIRQEGSDRWISDPANDRAVTVPPGRTTYTRSFNVPADAPGGEYDLAWGLFAPDKRTSLGLDIAQRTLHVDNPAAAPTSPAPRSSGPIPGTLVLVHKTAAGGNAIYRLGPNDRASAPLTTPGAGWDWAPSVSPDGQLIAFATGTPGHPDIATMRRDGSGRRILARSTDELAVGSPAWMPDGRIGLGGARASGWGEIFAVPVTGGTPTQITDTPGIEGTRIPSWPRGGGSLAFTGTQGDVFRIFVGSPGSRAVSAPGVNAYAPAWSPDGRRIAYQSGGGPARAGVITVSADGTNERRVVAVTGNTWAHSPAWSPDGRWMAYVSNQSASIGDDYGDLYVVPSDGGQPVRLTSDGQVYDWRPAWLP